MQQSTTCKAKHALNNAQHATFKFKTFQQSTIINLSSKAHHAITFKFTIFAQPWQNIDKIYMNVYSPSSSGTCLFFYNVFLFILSLLLLLEHCINPDVISPKLAPSLLPASSFYDRKSSPFIWLSVWFCRPYIFWWPNDLLLTDQSEDCLWKLRSNGDVNVTECVDYDKNARFHWLI